jgi:hypothetical protein
LARLTEGGLQVWNTAPFQERATPGASELYAVVAIAGGAFLALGQEGLYRLSATETKMRRFPRVPWLGLPEIWPHPQSVTRLLVRYQADAQISEYEFDIEAAAVLSPSRRIELPGAAGRSVALLGMGRFVYTAGDVVRLVSSFPGTKIEERPFPNEVDFAGGKWLPASAPSRAFHAGGTDGVRVIDLHPRFSVRRHCPVEGSIYEASSAANRVALVLVQQAPGAPRHWQLQVIDETCQVHLSEALPAAVGRKTPRSLVEELEGRAVALSPDGHFVAVGGPRFVRVYDVAKRTLLHAEDAPGGSRESSTAGSGSR